ncbi:class I SAM-dependent RNA methyltransferase [Ruminococcus sp. XPD3002]|uniref:THUMP domain-containing class I SAM-dependent RNA methyltransferase n=1 Tax=Ruminococcus sp. XPD3002 TaxID=1452269 RepID=UPI0009181E97|nr:class I SAM-dependent RNA methyltransferase [Ruminococcus sp.]SFX31246.1 putative N6-adenine-specific DNA methylase [Ruminococcus flavefaciens]HPY84441.1 class I SAM-dependent RNA methyltransferase [Ruminococcus flavefaciens]HRU97576.1 class I SAM-dependent RNA methyltransferase [Ruminococcus sp.]
MSNTMRLCCPCHFGLESVLKYEITKIGGTDLKVSDGKISFTGDENIMARANLCLSTAERVLIELIEFRAESFEELFQGVRAIELERYIGVNDAFPVKGYSLDSTLHSVPDCQSIIKKAAVERLKSKYGVSWFDETGPAIQIKFSILKDVVTIYLDTSGVGLHKRGYRKNSNAAPIKETLAAGIVDLARVRADSIVCDPFCGSGTLLIEAAMKALKIPVGINRRFAAEKWASIDSKVWQEERKRAIDQVDRSAEFEGIGFDIDDAAVALTLDNAHKAGIKSRIRVEQADISSFRQPEDSIVICNPPYGERLLELREAEGIYRQMGRVLGKGGNRQSYIISPHEQFEQFFGSPAKKRRKLYNGMIKCQLYMYF